MARISAPPPLVSDVRPNVPPVLEAIDRKALSPDPAARYATAEAMAEALEAFLGDQPSRAGAAAAAGVAAGADATAARAYPPDAYAGQPATPPPPPPAQIVEEPEEPRGTSPWTWVAGLLGLGILVVVGFLAFRLLAGGGGDQPTPGPGTVSLPSFIDQTFDNALATADQLGVTLEPTPVKRNDKPEGTIVNQDPAAGTVVDRGSTVKVEVVSGKEFVPVPEIIGLPEAEAITAITDAKLKLGIRTTDFDGAVPEGSVISTSLPAGLEVPTGTAIDYVVSKGPEPTPSPTPTPQPTAAPTPTPAPTQAPTPPPAPTPTPVPTVTVGTYTGLTVAAAKAQATSEGLVIQWQGATPADTDVVTAQNPAPGTEVKLGSPILLSASPPAP
jgi:serine/threonine-protein kinase